MTEHRSKEWVCISRRTKEALQRLIAQGKTQDEQSMRDAHLVEMWMFAFTLITDEDFDDRLHAVPGFPDCTLYRWHDGGILLRRGEEKLIHVGNGINAEYYLYQVFRAILGDDQE